jgi:hypothetical protein
MLVYQLCRVGANFLAHFTHTGLQRAFSGVNTTLRHLPGFGAAVDATPGKNKAIII